MRKLAIFTVILTVLATLAGRSDTPAPSEPSVTWLADLQRKMAGVNTVYLEFTQERHLKIFTDPLKSEGVMLVGQPDLIRWETTAPYQSILLGNRKSVAQFEYNQGKWEKLKLGYPQVLRRVMDQMSLMYQGKMDALTKDFTISLTATNGLNLIQLVPKDETVRSMMASLEVWLALDFSTTREVVMREPAGDFTRIIFNREQRNLVFPVGTFDQTKPLEIAAIRKVRDDAP